MSYRGIERNACNTAALRKQPKILAAERIKALGPLYTKRESEFWAKVDRRGDNECWLWKGQINPIFGYGYASANLLYGQSTPAHRLAYFFTYGILWRGKEHLIMHTCDNPPCCNPLHLRHGTPADNMHDAQRKGRMPACFDGLDKHQRHRMRYRTNPEYKARERERWNACFKRPSKMRETILKRSAERYAAIKADPERYARYRAMQRAASARRRAAKAQA